MGRFFVYRSPTGRVCVCVCVYLIECGLETSKKAVWSLFWLQRHRKKKTLLSAQLKATPRSHTGDRDISPQLHKFGTRCSGPDLSPGYFRYALGSGMRRPRNVRYICTLFPKLWDSTSRYMERTHQLWSSLRIKCLRSNLKGDVICCKGKWHNDGLHGLSKGMSKS